MRILLTILFMVWMNACMAQQSDAIHYTSLNTAIYLGQYDGTETAGELKQFGDFGLGSEERLASELILLDGVLYSIPATGKLTRMKADARIPFAAVKNFIAEKKFSIKKKLTFEQLQGVLDSLIGPNRFAAVKITGRFSFIQFRSFVEQTKPYRPLEEAEEVFFDHKDFQGTLVGFFTPKSAEALNSPVYHFHVVDQKFTTGGHLTACLIVDAIIEVDFASQLIIDLPSVENLNQINLNQEVEKKN